MPTIFFLLQHAAGIKVKFGEETESILVMVHDDLVLGDFFFFFFFFFMEDGKELVT